MDFIVLAVPAVVTAIMFGVKQLAGLAMFANGASAHPFLRFALVLFSLLGIVSTSLVTGNGIDADSVTALVRIALETTVSAAASHYIYVAIRSVMGE
jgi:hypothetical protein